MAQRTEKWVGEGVRRLERCTTLQALALEILRLLSGHLPSAAEDVEPDAYVSAVRAASPRSLREEIDAAIIQLVEQITEDNDSIDEEVAAETLLLASEIFAERERTDIYALLVRILGRPRHYPAAIAIAAGQCAIALGFRGLPAQWRDLHIAAGAPAVPTVMGGLARSDWQQLGDWIVEQRGEAWVERTYINLLPVFTAVHGSERVRELVQRVAPIISSDGANEIARSLSRLGVGTAPTPMMERPVVIDDWEAAIHEYVDDLVIAAPPADYFTSMFTRTAHARRAQQAFLAALKDIVQPWQVDEREAADADVRMLRLIEAFLPAGGFDKAVDTLRRHLDDGGTDARSAAIADAALAVLAKTYRRPPPRTQKDPAFTLCIALLHELARDSVAGPGAIRHLIRLDQANFLDSAFAAAVVNASETIVAAVDAAIEPRNDQQLTWLLNAILDQRSAPAFDAFLGRIREREPYAVALLNRITVPPQSVLIVANTNLREFSERTLADRKRHHAGYKDVVE